MSLKTLPRAEFEEGQPQVQVAQRVELRADEVPIDKRALGVSCHRKDCVPEDTAVHVLEAEDEHLDDEVAQIEDVHGEILAHRDHGIHDQRK